MGLTVVHPKTEDNENLKVDLIAVHGLNGDPIETWRPPKTKELWLEKFLPLDVIGARVLSFGYNADTLFGNTTADIVDHSRGLLNDLVDQREDENEQQRPIIFIAHSLGGIVVKQALFQARIEPQYNSINKSTIGIVFLGTPHRGSEKASYGTVLANIAATACHGPTSRLLRALQVNSDSLMRLTSDFKHQLPDYRIASFYELKPTKPFSTLIVEKHSALLEVIGEDQVPVDANHSDMCKFEARSNPIYQSLSKRINRMLKGRNDESINKIDASVTRNKYYNVPHNVSAVFTGRQDICQQLEETCLPVTAGSAQRIQKRFVVYGLGGSGKTQVCLKFAQDNREKFWGIFWIDTSSSKTIEQGYQDIGQVCELGKDIKIIQRWLSNSEEPWLLIFDNADDPLLDVSPYFPTGNRGSILLTTRNPDCKVHATVGSVEFDRMVPEEAIMLLLKAAMVENVSSEDSQNLAQPIVETLGCLALAIVQAGAVIRQKLCAMKDYCEVYSRQRTKLLSHRPIQASSDYRFTVYTTWEVSVNMIKEMSSETAKNAIELLQFFSFLHHDGISEEIFKRAWTNMQTQQPSEWEQSHRLRVLCNNKEGWGPYSIREAIVLLSSFSLISMNGINDCISMHPLVHMWARDRMIESESLKSWIVSVVTLATAISWKYQSSDYGFRRSLLSHISSCLKPYQGKMFVTRDGETHMPGIAAKFALVYSEAGRGQEAVKLQEQVLQMRKKILGEEHPGTLTSMNNLAKSYSKLDRRQEAVKLQEQVLQMRKRILGEEHPDTLTSMNNLACGYSKLGRRQEAKKLKEQTLQMGKKILGEEHPDTLTLMNNLASSYSKLGRRQEAVKLYEQAMQMSKRILGEEHPDTLTSMNNLAWNYSELGRSDPNRRQEAVKLQEQVLQMSKRILGEEHPDTLFYAKNLRSVSAG